MKTTVVIGCTAGSDWALPLPFTCLFWREVVGYEPYVFLVGTDAEISSAPMVRTMDALRQFEVRYAVVEPVAGHSLVASAKHVRQHAASLSMFTDGDWIMAADADLWPLKRDFYHQHDDDGEQLAVLYYYNGDGFKSAEATLPAFESDHRFPTIPMCHTTLRAREWRSAWQLEPDDLRGSMKRTFERRRVGDVSRRPEDETPENWAWWMDSDQRVSTATLCEQPWFSDRVKFIERPPGKEGPPDDRLDRGNLKHGWGGPGSFALANALKKSASTLPWLDAHVPKNPHEPKEWGRLLPLIDSLLPAHSAFARTFHKEWK